MALLKQIELNNAGINLAYWRIINLNTDYVSRTTEVVLGGYLDQDARTAGKFLAKTISMKIPEILETRAAAYVRLKSAVTGLRGITTVDINPFTGAVDA